MAVTLFRDLAYLGAAKQSVKGTGVAPSKFFILRKQAFMPAQKISEFRTGNQRDISFAVKEDFRYAGSFQTFLYADEGAFLLANLMGTDTKSGGSDPYTHTLSFTEPLNYLSVEAAFNESQIIDRVIDSKLGRALIEFEASKEVLLTVDVLGSNVAVQGSAATVSFSNSAGEGPMHMYHGAFTLGGPSDATTLAAQIEKGSITIDQMLSAEYGPGQIIPIAIFEQGRKVSLKLTVKFSGPALHNLIHYGGSSGTAPSQIVGTGSFDAVFTSQAASPGPERSAKFTSAQLFWMSGKPEFSPDGNTATYDVEATAYRSGATLPFTSIFKNGVSTAYT